MVNELLSYLKTLKQCGELIPLEIDKLNDLINLLENNILIPKSKVLYRIFNIDSPFGAEIEEISIFNVDAWTLLHLEACNIYRTKEEAKKAIKEW